MLMVATGPRQIAVARALLIRQLTQGATIERRTLVWPGPERKIEDARILFRPGDELWAFFADKPGPSPRRRWNCWYGIELTEGTAMQAVIEINIAVAPKDRRLTGRILVDEGGRFYLAHKGELRGGRSGVVSQADFESLVRGFTKQEVVWADEKPEQLFVIGEIGSSDFIGRLQGFVAEAARMRMLARQGKLRDALKKSQAFRLGTSGKTKGRRASDYDIERWHEDIVNALHAELKRNGVNSDKAPHAGMRPDLYTKRRNGDLDILFEAKTEQNTSVIYGAIGQLIVYGAAQKKPPRRVLVVESEIADANVKAALGHLGIRVLLFSRSRTSNRISFPDLNQVIGRPSQP